MMDNKNSRIRIRQLTIKDIGLFSKYRLDYLEELLGSSSTEQRNKTGKLLDEYFSEAMEQGHLHAVMALEGEKVLSFGAMVIKKIPGDFKKPFYLEGDILNMYTIPGARSRGLSTLVLDHLIDEARKRGICKLSLHTTKAGEKLYRNAGFKEPQYPVLELNL
ncbi:MAG: GNAT family N-acetyltransferase [Bacteroidia bacterium]|jgi:GNAT superfamily N-acetyltransferase|nr:GNAT family N-acetyltransferase [Bacteroidales bacterium]MDD3299923.1 GNAT family N-acetyltransferase [Bacteroidales bacterium]MDD3843723.1 GNAT family N-acetyltransferase [Bacteroidales bacterium]MDD4618804.1 GNAT family N-acetyltransferase [Bacteroidales bacterium]NCC45704.1 GNAT family N-acetyltransferase [Bacteroidia bacterium]